MLAIKKKVKHEDLNSGPKKGHFSIKENTMWIFLHFWNEISLREGNSRVVS